MGMNRVYRIFRRKGGSIFGRENIKKLGCGLYAETVKIASQNSMSIIFVGNFIQKNILTKLT